MYHIYHIKGVKIGVSEEPMNRTKKQGFNDYEIIETHNCIYEVSKREIELQKQYGLPIDKVPYHISRNNWGSKAGKVGGNTHSDLRNKKCSELGKRTGLTNVHLMVKNRRSYKGEGNHKCKITELQAKEILSYYDNLLLNSKSNYGLLAKTKKHFLHVSKYIVSKICTRTTWKHI